MKRRSFVSLLGTGPLLLRGEAARAGGMAPGSGRSSIIVPAGP